MTAYLGFGFPGGWELWIVLIIALLLFGHRIPGMARSLGSGIVEFRKGLKEGTSGDSKAEQGRSESSKNSGSQDKAPSDNEKDDA